MAQEEPIRDRIARYRILQAAISDRRAQEAIESLCAEYEARAAAQEAAPASNDGKGPAGSPA